MTLPATTAETKRSFSCMTRVKTWLRSAMASDRQSKLCVLRCHQERVDEEKANRILATMTTRPAALYWGEYWGEQSVTSLSMTTPTKILNVIQISLLIQRRMNGRWLRLFGRVMD